MKETTTYHKIDICVAFRDYNMIQFFIMKTCLYNNDPLKPHFYIVKLGFTGVYIIFLSFAQKHRLWYSLEPPRRVSTIYVLSKNMKKYQSFFILKV